MTPHPAVSAATEAAAEVPGMGRDLGTVEPGKLADLAVIDGNPPYDVKVLGRIDVVVKDGVVRDDRGWVRESVRPR